jgi:hypothetical protein
MERVFAASKRRKERKAKLPLYVGGVMEAKLHDP